MRLECKELLVDSLNCEVSLNRSLEEGLETGVTAVVGEFFPRETVGDTNTSTGNALVDAVTRGECVESSEASNIGCVDPAGWSSVVVVTREPIVDNTE